MDRSNNLSRSEFLGKCGSACLAAAGIMILGQSCASLKAVPYVLADKKIIVKKADLLNREYTVIKVEQLQAPIYICKNSTGYTALLMMCTHKSCEVSPYGKVLSCPCHGSEFDQSGEVLQGPAEKALTKFTVTEDEHAIYIQ